MSSKAQIIESLRETLTKVVKKDFSEVDALAGYIEGLVNESV